MHKEPFYVFYIIHKCVLNWKHTVLSIWELLFFIFSLELSLPKSSQSYWKWKWTIVTLLAVAMPWLQLTSLLTSTAVISRLLWLLLEAISHRPQPPSSSKQLSGPLAYCGPTQYCSEISFTESVDHFVVIESFYQFDIKLVCWFDASDIELRLGVYIIHRADGIYPM